MQQLTDEGRRIVNDVAQRHGFSSDAVTTMLIAVSAGYGNQAQFNHPEFGGMGQWSSGGMTMIGDMFNNYLKGRVASLCGELAGLIQGQPLFAMPAQSQSQSQGGGWQGQSGGSYQQQGSGGSSGSSLFVPNAQTANWWPTDLGNLGMPASTGAQNNLRYAYFPAVRRLAIDIGGQVSVYDTGDHQIGGFGQQQSGDQSITFTSQFGLVRVMDLPRINSANAMNPTTSNQSSPNQPSPNQSSPNQPFPNQTSPNQNYPSKPEPAAFAPSMEQTAPVPPAMTVSPAGRNATVQGQSDEIFSLIEKLADLHKKGVLTDTEYESKKGELLSRL